MRRLSIALLTGIVLSASALPAKAMFLQVDPVGYADQMNLYAYVGNDPLNRTDPSGRVIEETNLPTQAVAIAAQNAVEGTQYENDVEAQNELRQDTSASRQGMMGEVARDARNNYSDSTYVGGVKETGIIAELVEMTGGERNEFTTIPSNPQPGGGELQPAGQNVWGAPAQSAVITTIVSQTNTTSSRSFEASVAQITGTAQKLANSTGSPVVLTARNINRQNRATRHFAITPD